MSRMEKMSTDDIIKKQQEILGKLSPEERKMALDILGEYSKIGESEVLKELLDSDYAETPADISTFLHDKKYLGNALYDQEGRFTLFPYWEEKLKEVFPDRFTTAYNTIVLTGAIGLGKSTVAVICLLYMLHRLLCLKDPYLYYGLQPIDKISISLMNITLENAKGVALDKMNQMILSSEWFLAHGQMSGVSNLMFVPDKHIELITASSNNQVIGRAIFCNFTDECLDGDTLVLTENGYVKIKDLNNVESRFATMNPETGVLEYSEPCFVRETTQSDEYYEIELEDGSIVKCTPTHRFLLKDGTYKYAKDLTEDDELEDVSIKPSMTYDEFIQGIIDKRGQWGIGKDEYYEAHHIVPCCLGGLPERNASVYKYKYAHHPNIIWLYPDEHFIAHKLLAYEHPDIYGLRAAYTFSSANNTITDIDCSNLKILYHSMPQTLSENINKCKETKYKKRKEEIRKTDMDTSNNVKEMQRRRELGIQGNFGSKNGMYKNGYKVSGGRNGHANMLYTYKDKTFDCRKDLVAYLKQIDPRITCSVILRLTKGRSTLRAYNKYKDIFDNLSWRYKDEN